MKYFLHDTSSFDDEKIAELYINFGYEGLGLFYTFLEKIAKQEKPIKTSIIKCQLKIGKKLEKCWNFMEQIGLICSTNGESFNNNLLNFSESYKIKKEKTREKVSQWREKQKDIKNVTSYVSVSNPSKVKESKVKESKEEEGKEKVIPYEDIFVSYNKICGEKLSKILKLSDSRKAKIKKRWGEINGLEGFIELFNKVISIPFCCGDNERKWKADLDWLIDNDTNWVKVIEGKYNNKTDSKPLKETASREW